MVRVRVVRVTAPSMNRFSADAIRRGPPKPRRSFVCPLPMSAPWSSPAEPLRARMSRRLVTVPVVLVTLTLGLLLAAPVGAAFALLDAVRPLDAPWARMRFLAFSLWYLVHEVWGIGAATLYFLTGRAGDISRHFALQHAWEAAQLRGLRVIYGLRFTADADAARVPGEARSLVLVRHAPPMGRDELAHVLEGAQRQKLRVPARAPGTWEAKPHNTCGDLLERVYCVRLGRVSEWAPPP